MSRPRSIPMALVGALIAAAAIAVPATASASIPGWISRQLTSDAHDRGNVAVCGNRFVWQADDGEYTQIYTWKWSVDTTPVVVSTSDTQHYGPVVSGDRIAWLELVNVGALGSRYQAFTIKLGVDEEPWRASAEPYDCKDLVVSGDRLVWLQSDGVNDQLYTRKMGVDTTPTPLHVSDTTHRYPQVSGDRVVWVEDVAGYDQIFTWKSGGAAVQLTSDQNSHYLPHVSGERIVWEAGVGATNQIFTRKMGVDSAAKQLTTNSNAKDDPRVSGDRVVWTEFPGGLGQLYTRKVGTDTTPKAVSPLLPSMSPAELSGDRAVWWNYDAGLFRVYTRKIGTDSTSTVLVSGAENAQGAVVSGDRIGCLRYGTDTTIHQVLVAKRVTTPKITRSPLSSSITVRRKNGTARYTLSATIRDADGTLVTGGRVYLQSSANGTTKWKSIATLTTNGSGRVSRALSWKSRTTRYYRWYFPAATGFNAAYSSKVKMVIK